MKNLLMLIAVTFSFSMVNAQSVTKSNKAQSVHSAKESCKPGCEKTCCSKAEAKKKSCSGSKSKKSCAKTCGGSQAAYSKLVSPKDFLSYMDRFPSEQVIDVRTAKEVSEGMIDGAVNIDFNSDAFKVEMNSGKFDKNAAVMVYCRSGNRSGKAAELLKAWGFKKVYDMEGGYIAYKKAFPRK